eukprot:TRINITY_DN48086_c0_g1_i1.p1 TRINITY_DN48086_c0_g1~~TRINITY_DN48086_c0_g1_i1.p1  ORF type:complete len:444 (-),score=81.46 TRINITY_DN48086_c0_g1_i1:67-1332(-)
MGANQSVARVVGRHCMQRHVSFAAAVCVHYAQSHATNSYCQGSSAGGSIHGKHAPQGLMPATLGARTKQEVLVPALQMKEHQLGPDSKRNIVLLGLTGAGKSTLGNGMTKSKKFATADSMVSVTSTVDCMDFGKYRVIDTPGFFDTTMGHEEAAEALKTFANLAREGLAAVIIVVRNGRFTEENQAVIKFIEAVLGAEALGKYGIMVITGTFKSSEELRSELASLPEDNLGRKLADRLGGRVLAVGNPGPFSFCRKANPESVLKAAEQLFNFNAYNAIDCDMMNWNRVKEQMELEFQESTRAMREEHAEMLKMIEVQAEARTAEMEQLKKNMELQQKEFQQQIDDLTSLEQTRAAQLIESQQRIDELTSLEQTRTAQRIPMQSSYKPEPIIVVEKQSDGFGPGVVAGAVVTTAAFGGCTIQ